MKNLIIAAMMFVPTITFAEEQKMTPAQTCGLVANLSKSIMDNRQIGVPLVDMIDVPDNIEIEALANIVREIILEAYDRPKFSTKEYQIEAAEEFSNEVLLSCLKSLK